MKYDDGEEGFGPDSKGRREFLRKAGKYAAATPPAVAILFSTSLSAQATALSGGAKGPTWKNRNPSHWKRRHHKKHKPAKFLRWLFR